jgi:tetratricopeptide (TPR) repeat protein
LNGFVTHMNIEKILQQAIDHHKAGNFSEAESLYRTILTAEPKHPDANHNLGVLQKQGEQFSSALDFFKIALEANPIHGQYWLSYIDVLIHLEQLDTARKVLKKGKAMGLKGNAVNQLAERLKSAYEITSTLAQSQNKFSKRSDIEIDSAITLRESGAYHEAFCLLNGLTLKYPEDPEIIAHLAHLLVLLGKEDLAYKELRKALLIAPDLPLVQRNLARIYLKKRKAKEALTAASKACQLDSQNHENRLVLASTLLTSGEYEKAKVIIETVLQENSNYAEAYAIQGLLNLQHNNTQKALVDFEKALSIKPHLTQLWSHCANLYFKSKNLTKAINALEKVLILEPDNADNMNNLAEYYRQNKDFDKAQQLLEKATGIAPEHASLWTSYGLVLQQLGHINEARVVYRKALTINPNIAEVRINIGSIDFQVGEYDSAIKNYKSVIKIKPDFAEAYNNLGNVFRKLNLFDDSVKCYEKALEIKPDYFIAHCNLGVSLKMLGQLIVAVKKFERAIEHKPDFSEAHNNLGLTYFDLGQVDEAISYCKQALSINPNYVSAWENLFFSVRALESMAPLKDNWIELYEKELDEVVLKSSGFAILNFRLNAFKPHKVEDSFNAVIEALPLKTDEEIANPLPTQENQLPVLLSKNLIALFHFGRSGTGLLHSLIDNHPEISTLPSIYFSEYYNEEVWGKLIAQGWDQLPENFIRDFAVLFDARSSMPVPSIGDPIDNLGQKEGMANVGESRDEILVVNKETFCFELKQLMAGYSKLGPRLFFDLVHVAYEKALKNNAGKHTLFYHIHNPGSYAKLNFLRYNPESRLVMMVREPVQSCESWIRKEIMKSSEFVYNHIVVMLFDIDQTAFRRQDCIGVRLEDLKAHPKETIVALCNWMGVNEEESLYEMTAQGKKWWGDPSSPDYGKEGMSPFDKAAIKRPIGSIFSDQDQFILRTLFYPFRVRFGYAQENLKRFKRDLKEIKSFLDEPFGFEMQLAENLNQDLEEVTRSGSALYFRAALHDRWKILNECHGYPHMLKPLIINI